LAIPLERPREYGAVTRHAILNAAVLGEIIGRARRPPPRKIGRGTNDLCVPKTLFELMP
jgi:hypothetical protein